MIYGSNWACSRFWFKLGLFLRRLVRAAHAKGAHIILIQVCALKTFDINYSRRISYARCLFENWDNTLWFIYCLRFMCLFMDAFRNYLKVTTFVKHKGKTSFSGPGLTRAILQSRGTSFQILIGLWSYLGSWMLSYCNYLILYFRYNIIW